MFTIWFTGFPASGKTTLASQLQVEIEKKNYLNGTQWIDGDKLRKLNSHLEFNEKDRYINVNSARIASYFLNSNYIISIVSMITPYEEMRKQNREVLSNYIEIYVKCSWDTLIARDPKGLYQKALNGEITNFTGVSDDFEMPSNPDLIIDTDELSIDNCGDKIWCDAFVEIYRKCKRRK